MSISTDPAIRVVGLTKRYRSGDGFLVIFEDLNFEVERGEKLALVGESGAGKSTLLHLLGGRDRPTEGAICALRIRRSICRSTQSSLKLNLHV